MTWSKENVKHLKQKIKVIEDAMMNGPDAVRDSNYVAWFHSVPNLLLTLNGINLVVGKRGTGKTSFVLISLVEAFLEIQQKAIIAYLDELLSINELSDLTNLKIFIFNFRGVINLYHLNEILMERGRWFIEKHIESRQIKPNNLEEIRNRLDVFLRNLIVVQGSIPWEELKQMLAAMIDLPN